MTTISKSQEHEILEQVPKQLYIGGEWRDGAKGAIAVEDPSTGDTLCELADASEQDAKTALDAAVAAGPEWARTPPRAHAPPRGGARRRGQAGRRTGPGDAAVEADAGQDPAGGGSPRRGAEADRRPQRR